MRKPKVKKSGQKLVRNFSRFSKRAVEDGSEHIQENLINRAHRIKNVRLLILEWALMVGAIIFLAITQAFWYSNSYATITYTAGGTYTEATLGSINTLNPLFATTSSERTLSKLMFATLSAPDYSGHTGLDLASSIKTDDTGKVWTIKLREGAKWSDGTDITAEDVLYTVSVLQDSNINSAYSPNLAGVKVSEVGDNLIFTLPSAYANFSSALNIPILPAHVLKDTPNELLFESDFSTNPVTSGPFSYNATQSIGSDGEKIVYLTPNREYWGGSPMLDSFAVHAYQTEDDIASALNSGSVTATAELSPASKGKVTSTSIYEKQTSLASGVFAFFNTKSGLMTDKGLRSAVRQGLDLNSLRSHLSGELPLDYPLLYSQVPMADFPALPERNLDAAKEYIKNLNLPEDAQVSVITVSTGNLPTLAENFTAQLVSLGLPATTRVYDPTQEFLMGIIRPRSYDILIYEVELGSDPDLFAYYHSSQASEDGLNLSNYRNQLTDDLILGARSTMDAELRSAKYENFLRYWVDDVPAIGLYQGTLSYYLNKNVRSFSEDNRLVYPVDRFADIPYWAAVKTTKNRTP